MFNSSIIHIMENIKQGELYTNVRSQIRPLDMIAFKGDDPVSKLILYLENKTTHYNDFSHVGVVVTSEILDEPLLDPKKLYVLESTVSGKMGYNVYNIHGKSFLGVQIRCLDDLIETYDHPDDTAIAWCHLEHNPLDITDSTSDIKEKMTTLYHEVDHRFYDFNLYDLLSALYPMLRIYRNLVDKIFHSQKLMFCSELVAMVYKKLGVYPNPDAIDPMNIIPEHLVHPEGVMPALFDKTTYITTQSHKTPS